MIWKRIRKKTIVERRRIKLFASLKVAAGVLIIMGLGFLLRFMFLSVEQQRESFDFSPGQSKAILELADGQKIILEKDSTFMLKSSSGTEILNKKNALSYTPVETKKEVYNRLQTPRGGEYTITLSDGSKVYLNAESEFRYPETFTGDQRKVYLKGEAYFEVQYMKDKPFIVEVSGVQTRVLGTTFNIRSYPEEREIATTLINGKVNVVNQHSSVILNPGEQAVATDPATEINVKEVDIKNYTAWRYGRLIYDNEPLDNILMELSRWYDFELFYENEGAKKIPFSCNLKRYDNLSELLTILEKTYKVKFTINEESVVVKTL
jgi:ferric-dicitrate binding protein FerR (iron transport regulator)